MSVLQFLLNSSAGTGRRARDDGHLSHGHAAPAPGYATVNGPPPTASVRPFRFFGVSKPSAPVRSLYGGR